jgi:hypothetical protein
MILDNKLIGIKHLKQIKEESFEFWKDYHLRNDVEEYLEEENIEHTGEDVTDICRDIVGECFSE